MTVVLLLLVVLLILVNGFFVGCEFALVRSRRSRMEQMASEGVRGAKLALHQMEHVDEYVAACQVGITFASIGIGFLGEPAVAELIEPAFGGLSHGVAIGIYVAIAYALITYSHVLAGEQAPKMIAIASAERVMRAVARPLEVFRRLFTPFVVVTNSPARLFVTKV